MSVEGLLLGVVKVGILCFTGLIAQCSYRVGECQKEAIKNGIKAEDVPKACRP